MYRNYVTTALRNIFKHKLYSAINIGGLAVGLAACILIFLFVRDELSYDKWLPNSERIATVEITFIPPGREPFTFAGGPGPLKEALEAEFSSDVEHAVRVFSTNQTLRSGERQFDDTVSYVDREFFQVFDLPMAAGSREAALANNASVILSEEMARKYFGDGPAIGETLTVDNDYGLTVVGIFRDLPTATHLDLGLIALFDTERYKDSPWVAEQWFSVNTATYILFASIEARDRVASEMEAFTDRVVHEEISGVDLSKPSDVMKFHFMPIEDIHLYATAPGYPETGGDITAVITFSAVAVLILVIACINFMNLATARSMQRAREVSMRKVLGATKEQLVKQFLGETVLTACAALVLAAGLAETALAPFNAFLNKNVALDFLSDPLLLLVMVGLVIFVGILGGSYPAFYLSSFRPARILKANQSSAEGSPGLRNALVVFQFAISIGLIVATAIVYGQTLYARTMDPGFSKTDKLVLYSLSDVKEVSTRNTIKQRIEALPGVHMAAYSSDTPPLGSNNNTMLFPTASLGADGVLIENINVGYGFFETFGVEPLAGRLFSEDFPSDHRTNPAKNEPRENLSQGIIVNESFLGKFGFASPEDAIGKVVWDTLEGGVLIRTTIVGVVPDLYLRSLRYQITPLMYYVRPPSQTGFIFNNLNLDVYPGRMQETLAGVKEIWAELAPTVSFRSGYVDDDVAALYDAEEQRAQMFAAFSLFAVLVACLGLFGLASFSAEKRTKEIGIRKVMGAGVIDIVRLLVRQFSVPVIIANVIAWPTSFYFMSKWLTNFRYAIDLGDPVLLIGLFGGAGLLALLIAWATVAGHAYRVARANPVYALRYE